VKASASGKSRGEPSGGRECKQKKASKEECKIKRNTRSGCADCRLPKKLDNPLAYAREAGWSSHRAICKGNPRPRRPAKNAVQKSLIDKDKKDKKEKNMKLTSGVMGLFTGPHQTLFSDDSSLTIRLSEGERPVFAPEYALKAPLEVMAVPVS
jgi:hypothetical protein